MSVPAEVDLSAFGPQASIHEGTRWVDPPLHPGLSQAAYQILWHFSRNTGDTPFSPAFSVASGGSVRLSRPSLLHTAPAGRGTFLLLSTPGLAPWNPWRLPWPGCGRPCSAASTPAPRGGPQGSCFFPKLGFGNDGSKSPICWDSKTSVGMLLRCLTPRTWSWEVAVLELFLGLRDAHTICLFCFPFMYKSANICSWAVFSRCVLLEVGGKETKSLFFFLKYSFCPF